MQRKEESHSFIPPETHSTRRDGELRSVSESNGQIVLVDDIDGCPGGGSGDGEEELAREERSTNERRLRGEILTFHPLAYRVDK